LPELRPDFRANQGFEGAQKREKGKGKRAKKKIRFAPTPLTGRRGSADCAYRRAQ
jgi:hypothetical protein